MIVDLLSLFKGNVIHSTYGDQVTLFRRAPEERLIFRCGGSLGGSLVTPKS